MAGRQARRSLHERSADQIRNEQRGGNGRGNADDSGPEANATMRKVWDEPGGEAYNYRSATIGAGGKSENHGDLTAAETPDTTKHLSDATLSAKDKDATADAIERATAVNGDENRKA